MNSAINSLERIILPFAVKLGKQVHVNAIKNGFIRLLPLTGNDSNLLIVFYVQIMPDDFVMQLHRF